MARIISGVQPTGTLNIGGYLGAFRHWPTYQDEHEAYFFVADLHALTVRQDPVVLAGRTRDVAASLLAIGIDPTRATVFLQSEVAAHTRLAWLLQCSASIGEMQRMTQFKDKSAGKDMVSLGLLTYPALMAADVLLYQADAVPVGDDQRQHLELTRDLAIRFNNRYGETFVVPEAQISPVAGRIMDLQDPTKKMSKSNDSPMGAIDLTDEPEVIRRKISRAVTDSEAEVAYDPARKPGVSNLLELLAAATGQNPSQLAGQYDRYGTLKSDTAEAISELLRPVRERYGELCKDPGQIDAALATGAQRAREIAEDTYRRAARAMGVSC